MRTIFVTAFQGVEVKNLLRTGVLPALLAPGDVRVVCFVGTAEKKERYQREFAGRGVTFEAVDLRPAGWLERLFSRAKFHLLRTATTDLRRRMDLDATGHRLAYWLGRAVNRIVARPAVRRAVRWLDYHLVRDLNFAPYFDRHRPSAVLLAHLFDDRETAMLSESLRRRVPSVGFINSWDKLTARSALRLLPDELLVYNAVVRAEALAHADLPPERVRIAGIPQYDRYVGYQPSPRRSFLGRIGLLPGARFILYAPMGEAFSTSDWEVIDLLQGWVTSDLLAPDVRLFVRFQPNDRVDEAQIARRPWLRFDRPGTRFAAERGVDWDMSEAELIHLADTLAHASVLVCYASSISVDAAIFGVPVININFEIAPSHRLLTVPTQFYQMEHYRKAIGAGGIRLVGSKDELLDWVRRYLADPGLDAAGRKALVKSQVGELDGRSGQRVAAAVLTAAGRPTFSPRPLRYVAAEAACLLAGAILVGLLYLGPPLAIAGHLASSGQPFLLTAEAHRTDLHYLTRGREIFDGHFPPSDPSLDVFLPSPLNLMPPLIIAAFLRLTGGDVVYAYLGMVAVFPAMIFLLFYALGRRLFSERLWAAAFAFIGTLTPIALRIFNFDSGA